jgi:hypothetical protein
MEEITVGSGLTLSGGTLSSASGTTQGSIGITIDGAGGVITTGQKGGFISIPYSGTITGWTLFSTNGTTGAVTSGTIVVDGVLASSYSEDKNIPIESNLRPYMNAENVARNAPALHHALFAPARQLFHTFGLEWAKRVTSRHEENGWENLTLAGVVTDIVRETFVTA